MACIRCWSVQFLGLWVKGAYECRGLDSMAARSLLVLFFYVSMSSAYKLLVPPVFTILVLQNNLACILQKGTLGSLLDGHYVCGQVV